MDSNAHPSGPAGPSGQAVTLTHYQRGDISMRLLRYMWSGLGVILILSLSWSSQGSAQKTSLPASQVRIDKRQSFWTNQLRMARQSGGRALVGLQNAPADDSVPIDEGVLQAARDTYVLIRAAKAGMEIYSGELKYPDPVIDVTLKQVTDAWILARTPVDLITAGLSRQEYLTRAIRDLGQSIRLLDQALIVLP
jgi:hypothetical protein